MFRKLWVHADPVYLGWELANPEVVQGTSERSVCNDAQYRLPSSGRTIICKEAPTPTFLAFEQVSTEDLCYRARLSFSFQHFISQVQIFYYFVFSGIRKISIKVATEQRGRYRDSYFMQRRRILCSF